MYVTLILTVNQPFEKLHAARLWSNSLRAVVINDVILKGDLTNTPWCNMR